MEASLKIMISKFRYLLFQGAFFIICSDLGVPCSAGSPCIKNSLSLSTRGQLTARTRPEMMGLGSDDFPTMGICLVSMLGFGGVVLLSNHLVLCWICHVFPLWSPFCGPKIPVQKWSAKKKRCKPAPIGRSAGLSLNFPGAELYHPFIPSQHSSNIQTMVVFGSRKRC